MEPIRLIYDGSVNISVGRNRHDKNWKRKNTRLSEFWTLLESPVITQESVAEYRQMTRDEQTRRKDVGGFVGGTLKDGRRKAENVVSRSMLTLDLDFAPLNFWEDFKLLNDYAAAYYSTHSHTLTKPKLRLVIPLSREVTPEESIAVSRKIAEDIGIDYFDDTTYEPERLFFYPSRSKDALYEFDFQDGEWLDPDKVLALYDDWTDVDSWPVSSRAQAARKRLKDRAGDPLTKPGIIGAFCRAYDIPAVIATFLPDVYEATTDPSRYTYKAGSTAGGLVIYDDGRFAFSHHGTDKISGQLCNSFDLVRIHLYGDLDDEAQDGTRGNRLPSYQKLLEQLQDDPLVKRELASAKEEELLEDFGELEEGEEDPDAWKVKLSYNKNGRLEQTIDNALVILENDPRLKDKIRYNEFAERYEITGRLPWTDEPHTYNDMDDACLRHYLEKYRGYTNGTNLATALQVAMQRRAYHPVRDYLNSLTWDGVERLDTMLDDYLGVENLTPYVKAVTRKTFVAAVKRIFEPGCKFDYVLSLVGEQGIGKSGMLRVLAGPYLQESLPSMEGKDASEQLRGYWIVELDELSAIRKSELESTKSFITRQVDSYRVPYGKHVKDFPRQCIFIATTNDREFIADTSGGRRWWLVYLTGKPRVKGGWQTLTQETVDQIWAEALHRYKEGEKVWFDDPELERSAREQQRKARKESDKMGVVEEYLNTLLPANWYDWTIEDRRAFFAGEELLAGATTVDGALPIDEAPQQPDITRERVCVMEIWIECFGQDKARLGWRESNELHGIMTMMDGWEKYTGGSGKLRFGANYGPQRAYVRKGSNE